MSKWLGVDSGTLSILHSSVFQAYGLRADCKGDFLDVFEGQNVRLTFEADHGRVKHLNLVIQEDGKVYVGDPCYAVENWDKFGDDTDWLEKSIPGQAVFASTGGDGEFLVKVTIRD